MTRKEKVKQSDSTSNKEKAKSVKSKDSEQDYFKMIEQQIAGQVGKTMAAPSFKKKRVKSMKQKRGIITVSSLEEK